ncbi:MAG: hypothetical protein ABR497_08145 [Kiritimatiellia bacterium]|nr:hypothetical protein [Lentisphaerota bacterium]
MNIRLAEIRDSSTCSIERQGQSRKPIPAGTAAAMNSAAWPTPVTQTHYRNCYKPYSSLYGTLRQPGAQVDHHPLLLCIKILRNILNHCQQVGPFIALINNALIIGNHWSKQHACGFSHLARQNIARV